MTSTWRVVIGMNDILNREIPIYIHNGGDIVATSVQIGNEEYKIQENESGSKTLYRFNGTYGMWVQLQFVGKESEDSLAAIITETLRGEYLKNALNGDIGKLSKQVLTSGEIGVTIPSTEEKEG